MGFGIRTYREERERAGEERNRQTLLSLMAHSLQREVGRERKRSDCSASGEEEATSQQRWWLLQHRGDEPVQLGEGAAML
jgi:hypothetical protein